MARRRNIQSNRTGAHFITTTVLNFLKVFSISEEYYRIPLNNLKFYLEKYNSTLWGYVFMPNHIHLVVYFKEETSFSDFMRDFKKYTSVQIKNQLKLDGKENILMKLTEYSRIGKYKLWMDRFDCVEIVTEKVLRTKLNYIHYNPVKAGLVEKMTDWKYSSASNYYLDDHSLIKVATDWSFK